MGKILIFLYGIASYVIFFVTFLYLIAFVGNFDMLPYVTKTIDSGQPGPLGTSIMISVGLVSLFALTHSVMARQCFKRQWTKIVPPASERSTYVLVSSLCLIVLYVYWQPMPDIVWQTDNSTWILILWAGLLLGFGIVLVSTFLINHFELFGLQQIYNNLKGVEMPMV
jgi:protein-S-isoprenylcysteine O-methyltransferase Ste14